MITWTTHDMILRLFAFLDGSDHNIPLHPLISFYNGYTGNSSLILEQISADMREIAIPWHPLFVRLKFFKDHLGPISKGLDTPWRRVDSKEGAVAAEWRAKSPQLEYFNSDQSRLIKLESSPCECGRAEAHRHDKGEPALRLNCPH